MFNRLISQIVNHKIHLNIVCKTYHNYFIIRLFHDLFVYLFSRLFYDLFIRLFYDLIFNLLFSQFNTCSLLSRTELQYIFYA